ncbi:hypothetical protein ACHWQZ_G010998 [Mnemiopsis leidyi]
MRSHLWLVILFSVFQGAPVAGKVRFYLANLKNDLSVYFHTPLPVVTSTTFFLNVTFSGTSPLGCGLAFNIIDIHEIMYHLDFRINYKDMLEKLVQSYQVDDVWQKEVVSREKLELRTGGNAVEVEDFTNSSGEGQIQLLSYTESADCGDTCELYFMNFLIADEDGLVQYQVKQTSTMGTSSATVDFSKIKELNEWFVVNIRTKTRVFISFEVWDEDWGFDDYLRSMVEVLVPFSNTAVADGWTQFSSMSSDFAAILKGKYRLSRCNPQFDGLVCDSCAEYYHNPQCNKYCRPRAGYYTCSWSGDKVCSERRAGENCLDCASRFKGPECMSCALNFYPDGTCNVYCLPDGEKYGCTVYGKKSCLGNRAGPDCETCLPGHYGADCTGFCEESANHRCDASGHKVCKEDYYPEGRCDTRCVPVPGNFTCNPSTGERVCEGDKMGEHCDRCKNGKVGAKCDTCEKHLQQSDREVCKEYCRLGDRYWCTDTGLEVCLNGGTVVVKDCHEGLGINNCSVAENCGFMMIRKDETKAE